MYRVRSTLEVFSAINISDWTNPFLSEQRLESTDWNMSPWCVKFQYIGSLYLNTPFPLIRTDPWSSHTFANLLHDLHLYILCVENSLYRKGRGGGEEKKWSVFRGYLSLISSPFLCYLYFAQIKLFRSSESERGRRGYLVHQGLYTVSLLSFVNFLLTMYSIAKQRVTPM